MKAVLFLLCNFTFVYLTQSKTLNDEKVGVSNKKSQEHIKKAIDAFRDVVLNGDKEFDIPVLEPFNLKDTKLEFTSSSHNFRLNMEHIKLSGLSEYETLYTNLNPKKLQLHFKVELKSLQILGHYQLNGYIFKQWLPIYGDGEFTITTIADHVYLWVNIELSLIQSLLNAEKVDLSLSYSDVPFYKLSATGLMDLPSEFVDDEINKILMEMIDPDSEQVNRLLTNYGLQVVKKYIEGKTLSEVIELIDYFAQKA